MSGVAEAWRFWFSTISANSGSNCFFEDITSSSKESAIFIIYINKLKSTLNVSDCTFTNCYSTTVGAIVACLNSASIYRSCFYHCSGDQYSTINIQSKSGSELSLTYSTIQQSLQNNDQITTRSCVSLDGGLLKFQNNNITSNYLNVNTEHTYAIVELWTRGSIECKDSTFESNQRVSTLAILSISPFKEISRINFFNNTALSPYALIAFSYEVIIKNSIMKQNKVETIWQILQSDPNEQESYCLYLVDCEIDSSIQESNIYFSADPHQFNKNPSTLELDLLNAGICQGHQLKDSSNNDEGLSSAAIFGIFLVCLLFASVIVFFIVYKNNDRLQRFFRRCTKREKLPDYEVGLADIQVERE